MARTLFAPLHVRAEAELELRRRQRARGASDFTDFIRRHNPTLLDYAHVPRLAEVGERFITGAIKRLIVILPPRYFKTEVFSRLLPAAFLRRFPTEHVGLASYGASLAWAISEEARTYYQADGGALSPSTAAKSRWRSGQLGEMWASGVGGPLLGLGYHRGIVDDPTDPEKAMSPVYQRRFQDWWPAKFLSRQEPGAGIVVVMQRLGLDDPIDFLFRREVGEHADLAPEHWHVVLMDEIRSHEPLGRWTGELGLPPTCTLEPDPRPDRAILAPTRFDETAVHALQTSAGPLVASAQRQGRPMRPSGDFWRLADFRTYDTLPADAYNGGHDWDAAYTKNDANSASARITSYRGPGAEGAFPVYIDDVWWDWLEFPELCAAMREARELPQYVEQKASGKSLVQALKAEGIAAHEVPVKGGKLARASYVQPVVTSKRIYVQSRIVHTLLYGERQGLLRVTAEQLQQEGADLDTIDAFVQALTRHVGLYRRMAPRILTATTKL